MTLSRVLGVARDAPIPAERIEAVKMGTTIATKALLERKGEPTALFITRGFRDALRIGYQNRPRIFDRHIVLPEMLYSAVHEIDERVGARGEVLTPLDLAQAGSSDAMCSLLQDIKYVLKSNSYIDYCCIACDIHARAKHC